MAPPGLGRASGAPGAALLRIGSLATAGPADLAMKERALARTAPHQTRPGRYRPTDSLLAFLEDL